MERLYLIRVGMERFVGPYTFRQMKVAFQQMQFGLQDEICGSLRQWVAFDNIDAIRRHYPELVQFIEDDMLSGWGGMASQHNSSSISQMNVGTIATGEPSSRSSGLLVGGAILLVLAAVLGFFSYQDGEWVNPVAMLKDRTYYQARTLYGDRYNARFEGHMDRSRVEINQAMRKKRGFFQWLPYVRSVAFAKEGKWDGLHAKKLRGQVEGFLPMDCSLSSWDERWRNSRNDWAAFLEGRELPNAEWAKLLLMDTHWVRNRSPMPGWLDPGSYHEGCLRMAMRSLTRMAASDSSWDAKVFLSRLRWQLGTVTRSSPSEEYEMSGTLWATSCLEDAADPAEIKNCFSSIRVRKPWQDFFDASVTQRKMALLIGNKTSLSDAEQRSISEWMEEFQANASNLPLSYEEDLIFYKEILQQKGNVRAARSSVQKKFPHIQFEP